jgi:hypothetical protein
MREPHLLATTIGFQALRGKRVSASKASRISPGVRDARDPETSFLGLATDSAVWKLLLQEVDGPVLQSVVAPDLQG